MYLRTRSTLLWGAQSTAWGYLAPPYSIVVISSLGAEFSIALTKTSTGFFFVFSSINPKVSKTRLYTVWLFPVHFPDVNLCFFPLCPGTISLFINLSTIEYLFFQNLTTVFLPPVLGTRIGVKLIYPTNPLSCISTFVSHLLNSFIFYLSLSSLLLKHLDFDH